MSNQGWSQLPRTNKTAGEKVFDVVTWPLRKVFHAVAERLLLRHQEKRQARDGDAATDPTSPVPPAAPTPPRR